MTAESGVSLKQENERNPQTNTIFVTRFPKRFPSMNAGSAIAVQRIPNSSCALSKLPLPPVDRGNRHRRPTSCSGRGWGASSSPDWRRRRSPPPYVVPTLGSRRCGGRAQRVRRRMGRRRRRWTTCRTSSSVVSVRARPYSSAAWFGADRRRNRQWTPPQTLQRRTRSTMTTLNTPQGIKLAAASADLHRRPPHTRAAAAAAALRRPPPFGPR